MDLFGNKKAQKNMATEDTENSIIFNRGERKGRRVYKYMHIYLWSILCFETKIARICLATKRHKGLRPQRTQRMQ